jgi:hypothetical protein
MTKLKLMAAISATALMLGGTVATTASAQPGRYYDRDYNHYDRYNHYDSGRLTTSYVDSLEWRINNSPIPFGERRALLRELRQIQPLAWRVQTGQASRWEYNRLVNGVARIERATQYASNDNRYRRYGYNRY